MPFCLSSPSQQWKCLCHTPHSPAELDLQLEIIRDLCATVKRRASQADKLEELRFIEPSFFR